MSQCQQARLWSIAAVFASFMFILLLLHCTNARRTGTCTHGAFSSHFLGRRMHINSRCDSRRVKIGPLYKSNVDFVDDNDEDLFRQLYEERTPRPATTANKQCAYETPVSTARKSSPHQIVRHLLSIFSRVCNNEDVQDALDEAFAFTSVQEFDGIYPRFPSSRIRKSWKHGQPTQLLATAMKKHDFLHHDIRQASYTRGLQAAEFDAELEREYSSLFGCSTYRMLVSAKEMGDSLDRLDQVDVMVEHVQRGIGINKKKSTVFRFYLERSEMAAMHKDEWMIYQVKQLE